MAHGDRRSSPRQPCTITALVRGEDGLVAGTIVNYSEGGLFVAADAPLDEGSVVTARFRNPLNGEMTRSDALVVRVVMEGEPSGPQSGMALELLLKLSEQGARSPAEAAAIRAHPDTGIVHAIEEPGDRDPNLPELPGLSDLSMPPPLAAAAAEPSTAGRRGSDQDPAATSPRVATRALSIRLKAPRRPLLCGEVVDASTTGLFIRSELLPSMDLLMQGVITLPPELAPLPIQLRVRVVRLHPGSYGQPGGFGVRILDFRTPDDCTRFLAMYHELAARNAGS